MEHIAHRLLPILNIDRIYTAFVSTYDESFSFAGEYHEMWELDIILEGSAGITSGTEIYDCPCGTLIIHPANIFHNVWAKDGEPLKILTVSFTGSGVEQIIPTGKFIMNGREQVLSDLLRETVISFGGLRELGKNEYTDRQILKNLLETFLLSLYRRKTKSEKPIHDRNAVQFAEVATYLQEHTDDALTVLDICRVHAVGQTALKKLFKVYTGAGVMKYYNALRIRRSVELMEKGLSMAEIAETMHFSSQNYFSSFFKRETGVMPSRYFSKAKNEIPSAE